MVPESIFFISNSYILSLFSYPNSRLLRLCVRNLLISRNNGYVFCADLLLYQSLLLNTSLRDRYLRPSLFLEILLHRTALYRDQSFGISTGELLIRNHAIPSRLTRFTCNTSGYSRGRNANGRGVVTMCSNGSTWPRCWQTPGATIAPGMLGSRLALWTGLWCSIVADSSPLFLPIPRRMDPKDQFWSPDSWRLNRGRAPSREEVVPVEDLFVLAKEIALKVVPSWLCCPAIAPALAMRLLLKLIGPEMGINRIL